MTTRPHGVSYDAYVTLAKSMGSDPMDEETYKALPEDAEVAEDEDEDEDEDDAEKSESGDVDTDRLLKSLAALDDVVGANTDEGRQQYLLARANEGTISKSETAELATLLSGGGVNVDDADDADTISKSMLDGDYGEDTQDLFNASPFLKSLVDQTDMALERLGRQIDDGNDSTGNLIKAQGAVLGNLAKVVVRQVDVIKALESRLGIVERTPAKPRSVSADPRAVKPRDLAKGGSGADDPADQPLRKSTALRGLRLLATMADANKDDRALDNIIHVTSLVEGGGRMPTKMGMAVRRALAEADAA